MNLRLQVQFYKKNIKESDNWEFLTFKYTEMKLFNEKETIVFFTNCKRFELLPEEVLDHPTRKMNDLNPNNLIDQVLLRTHKKLSGFSFFLVHKLVTEKEVAIGFDDIKKYEIIWELVDEISSNGINYIVFSGWGDTAHGGYSQFESKLIGFPKEVIVKILFSLMTKYPQDYPLERMEKLKEINWIKTEINPMTGSKSLTIIKD